MKTLKILLLAFLLIFGLNSGCSSSLKCAKVAKGRKTADERRKEKKEKQTYHLYKKSVKKHWHKQSPDVRKRMNANLKTQKKAYRQGGEQKK